MLTAVEARVGTTRRQWLSYATAKRVMDVLASVLALVAIIPLWVVIAVAIKLGHPGGSHPAAHQRGRGPPAAQCAQRGDEPGRPAAVHPRACRAVQAG